MDDGLAGHLCWGGSICGIIVPRSPRSPPACLPPLPPASPPLAPARCPPPPRLPPLSALCPLRLSLRRLTGPLSSAPDLPGGRPNCRKRTGRPASAERSHASSEADLDVANSTTSPGAFTCSRACTAVATTLVWNVLPLDRSSSNQRVRGFRRHKSGRAGHTPTHKRHLGNMKIAGRCECCDHILQGHRTVGVGGPDIEQWASVGRTDRKLRLQGLAAHFTHY